MDPYTHTVLARDLQPLAAPQDPADYLWGAVAPGIRYLTGMRRDVTHLPDEVITSWLARYPEHASFIQGYRVHCLVDHIDAAEVLGRSFPLILARWARRKPFKYQQAVVMIGMYYYRAYPQGLTLVGEHNPIFAELGISAQQTRAYRAALAEFFACPSLETAIRCFTHLGLIEDTRIEKYMQAYRQITKKPLFLWALMTSVRNAHFESLARRAYQAL